MEDYPEPVTKQCTRKILEQTDEAIYKINEKEGNSEIGVFIKIKYKNKDIPVLITKLKILNEINNNIINISNNKEKIDIELGDILYLNNEYNILMIEIKEKKNINYIEIDDNINNKESIYIIQNDNINDILISYGIINNIENNKDIRYKSNIKSNYSFIFNLNNN